MEHHARRWKEIALQLNGIFIIAELGGEAGETIRRINEKYDPRRARYKPPHVTITGSSGAGPLPSSVTTSELWDKLPPVTATTTPPALASRPPQPVRQPDH